MSSDALNANHHVIDSLFHPSSIALVGASTDPLRWFINEFYLVPFQEMGFKGKLYAVNPRGGEVLGLPVYKSLAEVPPPVEYVISAVPATQTLKVLDDCRKVGTKVLQLYTAGFAEVGDEDTAELQARLLEKARSYNIRILGPNCMGIYNPKQGMSFCFNYPTQPGPIGLISQSGSNTTYVIRSANVRGLYFSKAVSYGNACDIDECDLIEYLGEDPDTRIIAAYIEGTTRGKHLREVLTKAASRKPVVIYKGGYTDGGKRAASSHTGALAGADAAWEAMIKQAGAIRVHTVDELVDMLVALLRMKPPRGLNVCAIGNGGGASLLATDELERAGFRLPALPDYLREKIKKLVPVAGSMLRNPFDASPLFGLEQGRLLTEHGKDGWEAALWSRRYLPGDGGMGDFMQMMDEWPGMDWMMIHYSIDSMPGTIHDWAITTGGGSAIVGAKECRLPVATAVHFITNELAWTPSLKLQKLCIDCGHPLFLSLRGAARAIRRLMEYNEKHPDLVASLQADRR